MMERYVINVDVKHGADELELNILQNQVLRWAKNFCLEPTRVAIHPYIRKEKIFKPDEEVLKAVSTSGKMGSEIHDKFHSQLGDRE